MSPCRNSSVGLKQRAQTIVTASALLLWFYPVYPVHPCLMFCVVEVALPFWFFRFRIDPCRKKAANALYRRHSSGSRDGFVEAAVFGVIVERFDLHNHFRYNVRTASVWVVG